MYIPLHERRISVPRGRLLSRTLFLILLGMTLAAMILATKCVYAQTYAQTDIVGPSGSGAFGQTVTVLPNGNLVVTDPLFDNGALVDVGTVYLYNGTTYALISRLTGSTANDQVGSGGIIVVANSNFVVRSMGWDNGSAVDAGAVTWVSGVNGVTGPIANTNSLIGSTTRDRIGEGGIEPLPNGNYLVVSPHWDNWERSEGSDTGAVTWCNGQAGASGTISEANSLVGISLGDSVGGGGVVVLTDGDYVVVSPTWSNGSEYAAGAVTWGDRSGGAVGPVTPANSLIGQRGSDSLGSGGVTPLSNGHYVVSSPNWDSALAQDVGAATWANSDGSTIGIVSEGNSLVGSTQSDQVSRAFSDTRMGITALTNGNYVVASPLWDRGSIVDAGAATWGNGSGGTVGMVTPGNSLVGGTASDYIGGDGVVALTNGNYVVVSENWDSGALRDVGAVTWGSGVGSNQGTISGHNSLIGGAGSDRVGSGGVVALLSGNYVVSSPDAFAATWGDGSSGVRGSILANNDLPGCAPLRYTTSVIPLANGNFLVHNNWCRSIANGTASNVVVWGNGYTGIKGGATANNSLWSAEGSDNVGSGGVIPLSNGNYAIISPSWGGGRVDAQGAVTWGNGATGTGGVISRFNSLVGSGSSDSVGSGGIVPLANGNYVVLSPLWDAGSTSPNMNVGAVTWRDGSTSTNGVVSSANSLVGSKLDDQIGFDRVFALPNGDYAVRSIVRDGSDVDSGSITYGDGDMGSSGFVTLHNSVYGDSANGGAELNVALGGSQDVLIVGRPADNTVTILEFPVQLMIAFAGRGSGIVNTAPNVTTCGNTCAAQLSASTVVTLTATPEFNSSFDGWTGACGGSGTCTVQVDGGQLVTTTFSMKQYPLSISKAGTGTGRVYGAGIDCGTTCTATFDPDVFLTLFAEPDEDSTFAGFSGPCSGVIMCDVTMNSARTVTATFTLKQYSVGVNKVGTGQGRVYGSGIDCGQTCSALFDHGAFLELFAEADEGSTFAEFSGACSDTTYCNVTVDAIKTVTATFELNYFTVDLALEGAGSGVIQVVVITPTPGVAATTAEEYPFGTVLELTAVPDSDSIFTGWTGDASGTQNPIRVTVSRPLDIGATFESLLPVKTFLPSIQR